MTRQASSHGSAKDPKRQLQDGEERGPRADPLQDCPAQAGRDVTGPWRQHPRGEGHIWDRKGHTWSTQTPCPGEEEEEEEVAEAGTPPDFPQPH